MAGELGIEVGDVVWTSYNTGPYRVNEVRACPTVYDYVAGRPLPAPEPLWSLTLEDLGRWCGPPINRFHRNRGPHYINGLRAPRRGRWFTTIGDEVFVQRAADAALQDDLFAGVA